jgi:hypothetical protein
MSHTTRFVKIVSPLALAIALAACGGSSEFGNKSGTTADGGGTTADGGAITPSGDSNPTSTIAAHSISVSASSRELFSDGANPVVISVVAKDKNNNLLTGANVSFSVDNDANLDVNTATGSVHTAKLTPGNPKNRSLTVTVKSGDQTKTIIIDVVGTSVVIDGPDAITLNKETPYLLKLTDSAKKSIGRQALTLTSSAGNIITVPNGKLETDAKGEIEFTLKGISGGTDNITVSALGTEFKK